MTNDVELNAAERYLLEWLSQEDEQQYGECYGPELDSLVDKGLAQVMGEDTETHNNFIAKGHGMLYRAVQITDAGLAILKVPQ